MPSTLSDILAKSSPRQTLVEHSREAIQHLIQFIQTFSGQVRRVARAIGISEDELVSRLFAAVWLHDIGKANRVFQARIWDASRLSGIPHPLLSVPFALAAVPPINGVPYEALAILSHHTPYYAGLYGTYETDLRVQYFWKPAWEFYQMLADEHRRVLGREYPFPLPEPVQWDSHALVAELRNAISEYPPPEARAIFGLLTAAIHYSDWLSSGHRTDWVYAVPDLRDQVRAKLEAYQSDSADSFASRVAPGIQARAAGAEGHLLLTAPTGSGKTEAALLWASQSSPTRLVYLLPTRVTSNAMYERVQRYVRDLAGLAHGTAGLVIGEEQSWAQEAFMSKVLYSSTFMLPAIVATVDQLLLAKFNWHQWGLVETNTAQAAVIFDEIHAYDLYTLGLILNAARELGECGARLCFTSATMPAFLREALGSVLKPFGGHALVDCPEADEEQRHALYVCDEPFENALDEIVAAYQQGQKVLVVVNTVGRACEMYQALKQRIGQRRTMLFHGRFIERDRQQREQRIRDAEHMVGGFAAVVTQVVEVSLDIDFDVMFTQVAPIDALAQRFGRVNRKGLKGLVPVLVFRADEGSAKVYGDDTLCIAWSLLKQIPQSTPLRQKDIKTLVEKQYPQGQWLQATLKAAEEAERRVREVRNQLWQVQTVQLSEHDDKLWRLAQSRQEQFPSMEVVPECFRREVEDCHYAVQRLQFIVRVPAYLIRHKIYDPELGVLFADIAYDPEVGAGCRSQSLRE